MSLLGKRHADAISPSTEKDKILSANKKKAPVVAVLNMKGGVGKTTISAHVFRHLYTKLQKSVILIDFDPQFNLTQQVISQDRYEELREAKRTIISVMEDNALPSIFKVDSKLGPPPPLADLSVRLRYNTAKPHINVSLVPGDFELAKYSLIGDENILTPVRARFLKFIDNCRLERDLVCMDCNPSSSFMTICALQAATHVLVPVRPDHFSILGLKMLSKYIEEYAGLAKKPKIIVLLNGATASPADLRVENALRADADFGPLTMVNSLPPSKLFKATGYTGFATDQSQSWRVTPRITAVVDELGTLLKL